ncbi:polymorphic toxin-type HINT domain-containing protein [Streptomyces sp. NPDC021096]|uniref:polymorphic toxin-type HINT domain-containing protein n=1 Tax=Streptomyces sp. NPDC021096 TaxID=3154792 RepID=UPI003408E91F
MSTAVAVAILGGSTGEATAATATRAEAASKAQALAALDRLAASLPKPAPAAPAAAPRTELDKISAERDRQLVQDYAEFDDEEEVREAAKKALESSDPNAIRDFLEKGEAEARKRAAEKRDGTDVKNRQQIEAMRGKGGAFFNAEVERVLKGTAKDRADFLAFGAEIAKQRDNKDKENAEKRAAELRKRVEMLAASGGPEVKKAAQAALDTNDNAKIEEFLEKGYQVAAQKDADARAAHEKAQKEAQEAAEKLRQLAEKAARAAEARTKLIAAHGDAVKALKNAANAMTSAAASSREADRMLAADRAGKGLSDYGNVKAEVARQVENATVAARQAKVAAAQAKVQADVLVETGLTYGTQWSEVASGIAAAAEAAVKAGETAQHAVDATEADAKGLNAKNQAELHEQQAKQWRANAEEHAKAAAKLAEAADKQAKIAADAAGRAKAARVAAEQAEKEAWEHARKTREARIEAQRQAAIAAEQRKIAERERDLAAAARARAERERDIAAAARARAEAEARTASAARAEALAAAATAAAARESAAEKEGRAAKADEHARGEESKARTARNQSLEAEKHYQDELARAKATEAFAAAVDGSAYAAAAKAAAISARADANTAGTAAGEARSAADTASGAAVGARSAATEAAGAAARARAAAAEATAHAARANAAANKAEAAAAAANAAANKAEAEAAATHAAALRANAKAAEATAQEARAGIAAHEAARLAGLAAAEANQAVQAANRTKEEAEGAVREAAMARLQAGIAVQASAAARNTAAGIADPANTAIDMTAPFSGKDVDADFAAAVATAAQEMGEEQVASAEAKANEAVKAADAAEEAAKRANAQVAPAFKAAADAARSSANAARSTAAAMKSAAEAAADGAKARAAAARANEADAQAQADAKLARQAANQAYADAAAARQAANQAEAEAARARGAASEAEGHAAAASSAADLAESEASVAQGAAAQAEKDATAAKSLAESAESHAKSAEKAAEKAMDYAKEADAAAARAEKYQRDQEAKARQEAAKSGKDGGPELTDEEKEALAQDGEMTPDELAEAQKFADKDILDYLKENGLELLIELAFEDIKKCVDTLDIPTCIWAVVQNLGPGKALKLADKLPAIWKAIRGIDKFLDKVSEAKAKVKKAQETLARLWKAMDCPRKHSFLPGTPVLLADGTRRPIEDIRIGDRVVATDPERGQTDARPVTNLFTTEDDKDFTRVTVATSQGPATITATANHPFWATDRKQWVDAGELRAGNVLRTPAGSGLAVTAVVNYHKRQRTHDLTVGDFHTYYVGVGTADALVHNCGDLEAAQRRFGADFAHTLKDHVNISPEDMLKKARDPRNKAGKATKWVDAKTAQEAVDKVLEKYAGRINDEVRKAGQTHRNGGKQITLPDMKFGDGSLGTYVTKDEKTGNAGNMVRVIIMTAKYDPAGKKVPGGFYVYTAYPVG